MPEQVCPQCRKPRPRSAMSKREATAEKGAALGRRARNWDESIEEHGMCPTCVEERESQTKG